ncbi:MAG: outer membrane protein assembly factor BamE [Rhodospirillales bacterium]|nr:outer membrane protein assembly factor BamE [Rhodospirillales bacterium]MSP79997.1 outer membrane protein assembly factor BamE [Rhodospirillales bacterium]
MFLVLLLGAGACAPRVHNQGHEVDPERLAQVEAGKTNRDQVLEILGSPSSNSTFGTEVWYYISQRVHSTLFFRPEVDDRKVIAVEFDEAGVVTAVNTVGLADGRTVQPVERVTPTTGHELTVIEQVLGNFGRFTRKPASPQSGSGGPPRQ